MARKKREESPAAGSPAWMATFSDLMNLLLCFFAVLFSMSTVDAEKFEQLAASLSSSFSIMQGGGSAIDDGVLISNGVSQLHELDEYFSNMGESNESDESEAMEKVKQKNIAEMEKLKEDITQEVTEQGITQKVEIDFTDKFVRMTLNGALLFDSGKADFREDATPLLDKIGTILYKYDKNMIDIEGHTDNIPIRSNKFENNFMLSTARSGAVAGYLMLNKGLNPATLKYSGRGEYVPIADNATAEGRARNRRVEIMIYPENSN